MNNQAGAVSSRTLTERLRQQQWAGSGMEGVRRAAHLATAELKGLFGIDSYLDNEDRRALEQVIFPYFLIDDRYKKVLFVGCSWCTRGYNRRFEAVKEYWTIDGWPWKRRYGARRHIVDDFQNIDRHFSAGTLDLILCNGVFGWGLNDRADVEAAFGACFDTLRVGGVLVVGWSNAEQERPFPLDECVSLGAFDRFVFPPVNTADYFLSASNYMYSFYVKRDEDRSAHSPRAQLPREAET